MQLVITDLRFGWVMLFAENVNFWMKIVCHVI